VLKRELGILAGRDRGIWIMTPGLGARTEKLAKPVRFCGRNGVAGYGNCLHVISVRLDSKHPPERHTVPLGIAEARTRVLAASDFITPRGDSLSYVYSLPQALTNRSSQRLAAARSALL